MVEKDSFAPICWSSGKPSPFRIDWNAPEPRSGVVGAWDRLVGPGHDNAEIYFWLFAIAAGSFSAIAYPLCLAAPWSWWKYLLIAIIAADVWGGVAVNASGPAKRWYHRPTVSGRDHMTFVAAHSVHLFIVAAIFHARPWTYFMAFTGALCVCTAAILTARGKCRDLIRRLRT